MSSEKSDENNNFNNWDHHLPPIGSMAHIALKTGCFYFSPQEHPPQKSNINNKGSKKSTKFTYSKGAILPDNWETIGEDRMQQILRRTNTVISQFAEILNTNIRAKIVKSKIDGLHYLYCYLNNFPLSVIGGCVQIEENDLENPPPAKIFEAWRGQFLQSFRCFMPPPVQSKIVKCVDNNGGYEWIERTIRSELVKEISGKFCEICLNDRYTTIQDSALEEYNPRDFESMNNRNNIIRKISQESKKFWNYERIGILLKS